MEVLGSSPAWSTNKNNNNNNMINIRTKLIHILGGYTKEEYTDNERIYHKNNKNFDKTSEECYNRGYQVGAKRVIEFLYNKGKNIYGVPSQEWINIMWKQIHFMYYRNIDSTVGDPYK